MSEWIKCSERRPPHGKFLAITNGQMSIYHALSSEQVFPGVTHWQPLPEPPKRESSFEQWWSSDHNGATWRDYKTAAREAWDAAIAASKRPDFVP